MQTLTIAVLPGDGVGPEVAAAAHQVWTAVQPSARTVRLDWVQHPAGAGEFLHLTRQVVAAL